MAKTLICDCNRSMPQDAGALGQALNETLRPHSSLCRRESADFVQACRTSTELVVACTQEQPLFEALAAQSGAGTAVLRFVNLRESAGWSAQAQQATPKMAALLARAQLPAPEPVPTVSYRSAGRLLVIAPLDRAEAVADGLGDALDITLFSQGPGQRGAAPVRRFPVLGGRIDRLEGWLGAFTLHWTPDNPIQLDLCTRCNACLSACPEQAIGLDYQIDLARCSGHRDCVSACGVAGAIDFQRQPQPETADFDLVLDLREHSAFARHTPPQGYFRADDAATLLRLRQLVGEFEKPRFFQYRAKLCAHSRNQQIACQACIEVCSAQAIHSDAAQQQIVVNPHLCVGCGACTTVCPSGALGYAYPRPSDQAQVLKTLLGSYRSAGGQAPVLLLHSQTRGQALIDALGRAARLGRAQGLPARVLPLALWHSASVGLDLWLSALAYGAQQVLVLCTDEEAPQYRAALQAQMDQATALLEGLGYGPMGLAVRLLQADDEAALDQALHAAVPPLLRDCPDPLPPARFAVQDDKRSTLELALDTLLRHAPALQAAAAADRPAAIALPAAGALWGSVQVDGSRCTLCMSCVSACPAGALQDNPQAPQLRFVEKNCVQCGLCVSTCPEQAVALQPRLLLDASRGEPRVLSETQAFGCVRCGKAFGTQKGVETLLARLAGHPMFQGEALQRLKMCGDCRVIDLFASGEQTRIQDL